MKRHFSDAAWDVVVLTNAKDFNASKVKIKSQQLAREVVKLINSILQGKPENHPDDRLEEHIKRFKALRSRAVLASRKKIRIDS